MLDHPPPINNLALVHSTRLRFITNGALVRQAVTDTNILDALLVAATAIAGYRLFQTAKIRKVSLWAVPVVGGATTVTLEYDSDVNGPLAGDSKVHTDTSMGIQPACIHTRPAVGCLAAMFNAGLQGNTLFHLSCPSGTVVDVEVTFRGQFGIGTAVTNALVGATAGAQYMRGLDGLATATTKLAPVAEFVQ
jgi:hypothetical protein